MICTAVCIISQSFGRTVTFEMFQGFLVVARNDASQQVGSFTSGGADSKTTCSVSIHKCLRQSQKHYTGVMVGLRFVGDPQIILECHFLACMPLPLTCINLRIWCMQVKCGETCVVLWIWWSYLNHVSSLVVGYERNNPHQRHWQELCVFYLDGASWGNWKSRISIFCCPVTTNVLV